MVHGVAASIRASQENETFDLGGQNADAIKSTIQSAFKDPFQLQDMIRITFVTGAGKQARQKYDDGAAKAVTSMLKECGYDEDRGASCVMSCAGSFKLQHDTGKNLKTVVVFPKVVEATGTGSTSGSDNSNGKLGNFTGKPESFIPESSPKYKLAVSSLSLFQNMVSNRCPSWSQKKGCLGAIEEVRKLIESLEATLMKGTPLNDSEQAFYDSVVGLDDKEAYLRHELHEHVETGNLTKFELELLRTQNAERITELQKEKKSAVKALERKELLAKIDPIPPEKLRNHAKIGKLRKELQPLLQNEERSKGRLLSMKETQAMARKEDILDEITHLEETSRGWFEDEHGFLSRLEASRKEFEANVRTKKLHGSKITVIGADTKVKVSPGKFVTPGESNRWTKTKTKKTGKLKAGAVFSAMTPRLDDSDSDDDDEHEHDDEHDDNDEEKEDHSDKNKINIGNPRVEAKRGIEDQNVNIRGTPTNGSSAPSGGEGTSKKKSKKKKKKSKSKQGNREEEQTSIAKSQSQNFLLTLLLSLFGSIIAFFFGKPKTRQNQRG